MIHIGYRSGFSRKIFNIDYIPWNQFTLGAELGPVCTFAGITSCEDYKKIGGAIWLIVNCLPYIFKDSSCFRF